MLLSISVMVTGRETKVGNLREWSLTSLSQNRPTIQKQSCLSEAKQPLAKFATGWNLLQVFDAVKFWLLRVKCKRVAIDVGICSEAFAMRGPVFSTSAF